MYVASAGKCKLNFWYNMYGDQMGDLNVYLKNEDGKLLRLFHQSGDQGEDWKQVCIIIRSLLSLY